MLGCNAFGIIDHLADMVRGDRPFCRFDDVEVSDILLEGLGIMRCDVPDTLGLRAGSCLHLVIARVGIGRQMANIGDVDDMGDIVTLPHQRPAQGVSEDIGAQVAKMSRSEENKSELKSLMRISYHVYCL